MNAAYDPKTKKEVVDPDSSHYWNTPQRGRGQIVSTMIPQLHGAAEGEGGSLEDVLRITCDGSDGDWWLEARKKAKGEWVEIAKGNRYAGQEVPGVSEAAKTRREFFAR